MSDDIRAVWANGRIPVIAIPPTGELKIRLPYSENNRGWLQITQRKPRWNRAEKCWVTPRAWLDRIARHAVSAFGRCYLVQSVSNTEKCAPACWNATGVDCDCPCKGENHGLENGDRWFVVSETFACRSGEREYSVRLISGRPVAVSVDDAMRRTTGIQWKTYFARASGSNLVKIGKSADVGKRLRSLQTGCPQAIELLAVFEGDHETRWHERFADRRASGEWFHLTDGDISQIEWIASEWVS